MSDQKQIENCKHCNNELVGSYCSRCGHPRELKRINGRYILSEIGSVLNFDKGILYTIRELLIRPGKNIQLFIREDRNRLVKPIIFIILCSLIYTIAQQLLLFEDGYVDYHGLKESTITVLFEWVQNNYGYANILMAVFIGLWIKILFRKYDFNFFEVLILLCFVMGIGMLIYTIFGIVESVTGLRVLHFGGLIGFLYISWSIGQFFDKKKKLNYLKGLISYILGMLTFVLLVIVLGVLIDLV